jgi:hypothetical protein
LKSCTGNQLCLPFHAVDWVGISDFWFDRNFIDSLDEKRFAISSALGEAMPGW